MSNSNSTYDAEKNKYVVSNTTKSQQADDTELQSHYQQGGRYFLDDPATGERLNVSRLTAYAEYGREIYDRDAHHEIPLLKVDASEFIDTLSREEHAEYHKKEPDPTDVDGFPLLRAEP